MAHWDMNALLSRQILLTLQGANWQRAGGKGSKPKPIPLPDDEGRDGRGKPSMADIGERLRNSGMIPSGTTD